MKAATGGVAVALDALMRERGGVWIAHGAGAADRLVVDASDKVRGAARQPVVRRCGGCGSRSRRSPPTTAASPTRACGRCATWSTSVRSFASEDWAAYQDINERFAAAIHAELGASDAPVFIQDYHLALVAPALRALRPDARTALFWHIPWPYPGSPPHLPVAARARRRAARQRPDRLSAGTRPPQLPDGRRRRAGRRGRARVVARALRRALEHGRVGADRRGLRPHPGASPPTRRSLPEQQRLRELLDLRADIIGLGVDRLDYTKGIPERLDALDALMTQRPELRGRLTFVQIGVPSRSDLESYAAIEAEIGQRIAALNARHAVPGGAPLVSYYTTPLGGVQPRGALPPRPLLHRQLAARRDEPGGQGVRGRAGR